MPSLRLAFSGWGGRTVSRRASSSVPQCRTSSRSKQVDWNCWTITSGDRQRIFERPADQVSWYDLSRLAERDAGAAWARVRTEARREFASGHRTAQALEWRGGPWQRARFLAIRDSFRDSVPPQSGIESTLVETAAEAFGDYLEWSEHLHMQVSTEVTAERTSLERHGDWSPVRLSSAEAIEQSASHLLMERGLGCRDDSSMDTLQHRRANRRMIVPQQGCSIPHVEVQTPLTIDVDQMRTISPRDVQWVSKMRVEAH
ncbi:MAG: hypothetical protein M3439_02075 [Chloroflexota bacterium]|nr:hypothetical protein [Chloroflexota bacterium]